MPFVHATRLNSRLTLYLAVSSDVRAIAQTEVGRLSADSSARQTDAGRVARTTSARVAGDVTPLTAPPGAAGAAEPAVRHVAAPRRRVVAAARVALTADGVPASLVAQPAGPRRRAHAPQVPAVARHSQLVITAAGHRRRYGTASNFEQKLRSNFNGM